ncbi:hypothetical protein FHS00_001319 [Limimaricola variabilis]|uniref:Uncharacterized protein n=1 Tax=Limimaricola variabilis TaxID=1492771 RepID=A0ABR6HMT2_9RHOB|nr:hypothetical protein [Limimaricola variabilis]MBB3711748.1 hypothetical protein [Limimaricola variabilis]
MSKHYAADDDDFLITDPEKQPGVISEVPAGVKPLRLEPIGYRANIEVRCAFCRNRQRHIYGFFAVLPDGSLALCGNCCAVEISDKSTVAKIKQDVKRREITNQNMIVIRELTRGLPEVLKVLERDVLPIEAQVNSTAKELEWLFPSSRGTWKTSKKLGLARGGLVSVLKITGKLGERDVEGVLEKRQRIFTAIREGLQELEVAAKALRAEPVKHALRTLARRDGYEQVTMRGTEVVVGSWIPDPDDDEMEIFSERTVPLLTVEVPDARELLGLIE